jgi:hypothetical protein
MMLQRKGALLAGAGLLVLAAPIALVAANPAAVVPPAAPAPAPTAAPAPAETAAPDGEAANGPADAGSEEDSSTSSGSNRLPTLEELEALDTDELDELFGLRPTYDIPSAQRRATTRVGILAEDEGGLPATSLARQPQSIIRAALTGTQGRLVSRWGHIALRRALASRLAPPEGMNGVEFAGLRAQLLNRMGEFGAARAIAQDVDVDVWNARLSNAAIDAYIATGDIVGACPLTMLRAGYRDDVEWQMLRSICSAYAGETARARNDLLRLRDRQGDGEGDVIDVLLAQRFAGAAGLGNSAVTIEWDDVDELTPWRYGLAAALGIDIPDRLIDDAGPYYQRVSASLPALPLSQRVEGARRAAREGIFSSAAMIDIYAQGYAASRDEGPLGTDAALLRAAYVDPDPAARVTAIRALWGDAAVIPYDRQVLTAYAAARIPARDGFAGEAGPLIASMLTAGLDRDAARWREVVDEGDAGWGLLAVGLPGNSGQVSNGAIDSYRDNDPTTGARRTRLLVAGLAGLGRVSDGTRNSWNRDLDLELSRETRWSALIDRAGEVRNAALVTMLMGVGMQGDDWSRMTPRHLYHIVSALRRSGMEAEARMIAAEALARA